MKDLNTMTVHKPRGQWMVWAIISCAVVNLAVFAPSVLWCQDYLSSTGTPGFSAPYPIEMGVVDAASGNLHLEFPIGSFPQRGGKGLNLRLVYDSHIWAKGSDGISNVWSPWITTGPSTYPGGWRLALPSQWWSPGAGGTVPVTNCAWDMVFYEPNGTQHYFNVFLGYSTAPCTQSAATSYAADSSGFRLDTMLVSGVAKFKLYAPDGTKVYDDLSGTSPEDSNGNYFVALPEGVTDTLGRGLPQILLTGGPQCVYVSPASVINYAGCLGLPNSQGRISQFNLTFATLTAKTNFQQAYVKECTSANNCLIPVITSITLPDGNKYSFMYDCDSTTDPVACGSPGGQSGYYGTMIRMTLPTGQTITYGYSNFADVSSDLSHWLTSKSNGNVWRFSESVLAKGGYKNYTCGGVAVSAFGCQQITVTKPDNSKDILTFAISSGAWLTKSVSYDRDGTTVLTTTVNTWDFSQPCQLIFVCGGVGAQDIRKTKSTTTLPVPGGNITKQITYAYDSPQHGNLTAIKEWKYQNGNAPTFSSVPDRATYMTYATIGTNNNINRPLSKAICNATGTDPDCPGGGAKVAKTIIAYDSYGRSNCRGVTGLVPITGIQNHDDGGFGMSYTQRGNPTSVQRWVSGTTYLSTTLYYDTTGQVVEADDPAASATCFSYTDAFFTENGTDNLTTYTSSAPTNAFVTQITDPVGSTSMGYYYGSGKTAVAKDYNGVSTYAHFVDPFDRPTESHYGVPPNTQSYTSWLVNTYTSSKQADSFSPVGDTVASAGCSSCTDSQVQLDNLGRMSTANLANNPAGAVSVGYTYDGFDRVASNTHPHIGTGDPNNVSETYQHDGLGRPVSVTHPDGQRARIAYGGSATYLGNLASQLGAPATYGYGFPVISMDEAGKQRQEWIDGFGNVIEADEPGGAPAFTSSSGTYGINMLALQYLDRGNISAYLSGTLITTVGFSPGEPGYPLAQAISNAINANSALPVTSTWVNNGGPGTVYVTSKTKGGDTNYALSITCTLADGSSCASRVAVSGMYGGSTTFPSPVATNYTYDVLGNLTRITQGLQTRTYRYDGLSRLTQKSTPEENSVVNGQTVQNPTTWSYVNAGGALCSGNPSNPCTRTDGRGIVTTYAYDAAGRLTSKAHTPSSTGPETYTYGSSAATYNIGRLLTLTDPSGSETYSYDPMGSVKKIAKVVNGTTYNVSYTYNAGGLLSTLTYPSGRKVYYNYDQVGHLCSVDVSPNVNCVPSSTPYLKISSSNYDALSRALTATYGNGVVATATYNPQRSQLQTLTYTKGASALFGLKYYYQLDSANCPTGNSFGNDGQIQCITDTVQSGRSIRYTYDSLSRVLTANTAGSTVYPSWGLSETYDRYGNRTAQSVTAGSGFGGSWTISPTTNQITGFTYDASGNLMAQPSPTSATFGYDGEECMTSFAGSGNNATYLCDGNNLRVKKVVTGTNAVTTVYIRSGRNVIAEYDNGAGVSAPTREYIFGHLRLATIAGSVGGIGGTITYEHRDHLSPRLLTDANGNVTAEQGTYPFGETWYRGNATVTFVYSDYERDQESGLDYAQARMYSGTLGRFMSPDPLNGSVSNPQSLNRYAFVFNDTVNQMDPVGMDGEEDGCPADACVTATPDDVPLFSMDAPLGGFDLASGNWVDLQGAFWTNGIPAPGAPWMATYLVIGKIKWVSLIQMPTLEDQQWSQFLKAMDADTSVSSLSEVAVNGIQGAQTAEAIWNLPSAVRSIGRLFRGPGIQTLGLARTGTETASDVWGLAPMARGVSIEKTLAETEYADWYHIGADNNGKFPLVDFQRDSNLVSLKTVDTTTSSWRSYIPAHIRDLGTRGATVNSAAANLILDVRVQPGGMAAAQYLIEYGQRYNVTVIIKEF